MGYQNQTIFIVALLDLEHRTNTISRDGGSFVSVSIEPTSAAQARANLRSGAEEDVKRLQTTGNIVDKDQSGEGPSSGLKEKFKPRKGKSMGRVRENAPAATYDNTDASFASHTDFTAAVLVVPSRLANITTTVSQNTDVLVNLGTVLDKIQRIVDVTVNAVDTLAQASSSAEHGQEISPNF